MTQTEIEAYVTAASAALQLPIAPGHRAGVLRYFALAADLAEQVGGLPLTLADEPAEVFIPIGPGDLA